MNVVAWHGNERLSAQLCELDGWRGACENSQNPPMHVGDRDDQFSREQRDALEDPRTMRESLVAC